MVVVARAYIAASGTFSLIFSEDEISGRSHRMSSEVNRNCLCGHLKRNASSLIGSNSLVMSVGCWFDDIIEGKGYVIKDEVLLTWIYLIFYCILLIWNTKYVMF